MHFSCIVSLPFLLQTNRLHVLGNKYTLLFYIVFIFCYDLSNSGTMHFSCIVSLPFLLQTDRLHVLGNKYTLLFYIVFIFYCDLSRICWKKYNVK